MQYDIKQQTKYFSNAILILSLVFLSSYFLFGYSVDSAQAATIKAPPSNLGLVAYYPMNEGIGTKAGDMSGNGHDTNAFTGTLTWVDAKRGKGINFPGSSYFTAPSSSAFAFGTGDFTVSGWFKLSTLASRQCFWETGNGGGGSAVLYLLRETNNTLTVGAHGIGALLNYTWSTTATNTWYHMVITRTGTSLQVYINGTSVASTTNSSSLGQQGFTVGLVTTPCSFYGVADDVRIYSRGLSSAEITTMYNSKEAKTGVSSSTDSLATSLLGHWTLDGGKMNWTSSTAGTATDSSGNNNTGTLTSMSQTATPTDGVIGQALNFDGTDDYVSMSNISSINNIAYTSISFWMKRNGTSQNCAAIFSQYTSATCDTDILVNPACAAAIGASDVLYVVRANTSNTYGYTTNGPIADNTWTHVVGVFDGTQTGNADRLKIYLNGVQQSLGFSGTIPATTCSTNTAAAVLGRYTGLTRYFKGSMDDVRIYSRALSTAEIKRLYNMGRPTVLSVNRSPILDNFSNAAIAYSLRKLSSTYTGYAINVRRTAGGTQDIGFVGNNLDTATLASFCASDDCYVVTWYDQSGNGKNITQASSTRQPQIVSAGTILTGANSKPIMSFDGNDDDLQNTSIGSFAQPRMVSAVMSATNAEYGAYPWTNAVTGGGYSWNGGLAGFGNLAFSISNSGGGACCSKTFVSGTNYIYQAYYNTSSSVTRLSNGANTTGSLSNDTITGFILGGFYEGGTTGHFATFKMSEFILWNMTADQSTRDTILKNQNAYYAIY